jgi:hypothetical protein
MSDMGLDLTSDVMCVCRGLLSMESAKLQRTPLK